MKSILIAITLSVMAGSCTTTQESPPVEVADPGAPAPIIFGESRKIVSAALGETRTYNVWLPPSYAEGARRYPVIFLIDGGVDQDFHHITGLAQLASISGMFRDVIIVGVETKDRRAELTFRSSDPEAIEKAPTHGQSTKFRSYIFDELKPVIEEDFRASGETALLGESLAGLFIVETFLKSPDVADIYLAISPSMWWDAMSLGKAAPGLLAALPTKERKIYLAIADEGGEMRDGVLAVVNEIKKQKRAGLAWTFSDRKDLTHSTIYHCEALDALIWAFPPPKEDLLN